MPVLPLLADAHASRPSDKKVCRLLYQAELTSLPISTIFITTEDIVTFRQGKKQVNAIAYYSTKNSSLLYCALCRFPFLLTRDVNRAAFRAVRFWKILPHTGQTFKNFRPQQLLVPHAAGVHLMMNLCKTQILFGSYCLRSQQLVFYSFYLRFSDASVRRFVGRILLLFYLQAVCYSHRSDALACGLLI